MIEFTNPIWDKVEGGYKTKYNPIIALKKLQNATSQEEVDIIYKELWEELHHQGDVGIASYLSIPQIVRIAKEKKLFDWNIIGLCAVIEQQRVLGNNPSLPVEYKTYYFQGLAELRDYILLNLNKKLDETTYRIALAGLVTADGKAKLGKAIMELEDDLLEEFLEQF